MEGVNHLFVVIILLFGVIILSLLKFQKSTSSKILPREGETEKDTETPFTSSKPNKNHYKIHKRCLPEDHQEINLVKSESQPLIFSPKQPIGEIARMANDLYSAADIQVHDLNTRGKIEKTIARVRAEHHPLYKFLSSEDKSIDKESE